MPGVIGANANLYLRPEASYGTLATGNYTRLGFLRAGLGVSQQLLDLRVLGIGQGRDAGDPMQGEIDTEGEVEIPLNQDGLGHWLRLLLGPPTTTGTSPNFVHVFASGAAALPSASVVLDYGATLPDRYLVLTGVRAGSLAIGFGPTGPATARIGLMAQGGGLQPTAVHGTPVTVTGTNFLRPQGRILKGATPLALVVAHAPQTLSGAICWEAGMLCVEAGMAGPTITLVPALAIAGEQGIGPTVAATLVGAMREGIITAKPSAQEHDAA